MGTQSRVTAQGMEREFAMEEGKTGEEAGLDCVEMKFGDKAVRRGFIRKVYSILCVQLSFTVASIAFFIFYIPRHYCTREETESIAYTYGIDMDTYPDTTSNVSVSKEEILLKICARQFAMDHQWMLWCSMGVSFLVLIPMACVRTLRVSFPANFLLLALFTVAEAVMLGLASMRYETDAVIIAAGITAVIVFALTVFAFQTKIDFTMMSGILICVLLVFVLFGLIAMFLPQSRTLHMVWGAIGALIFSIYLVYDTQMMMGGDHKYSLSPEEYIFAALAIYLDIMNIFMYLLRFVGAARSG